MSRFEIVGLYDCPWYAKVDKMSEEIVASNPTVEFHREMMDRFHWNDFVENMKRQRGWKIKRSPVIWEVLVEADGKANLIGDADDFCEFAIAYFGIHHNSSSVTLQDMVVSNKALFGRGFEGQDRGDSSIFNLSIINAPVKMLELVLTQLLSPVSMIPHGLLLNIKIYDEYTPSRELDGLMMELFDMASPHLFKTSVTTSFPMLFYQCHLLILMENLSQKQEEDSNDWITRVEMKVLPYFAAYRNSKSIKHSRVIIGGEGPQCYVAEIFRRMVSVSMVERGQIITASQYVAQRAKSEIGKVANIAATGLIGRLHCYGWPGLTGAYVEVADAVLRGGDTAVRGIGIEIPLVEIAGNSDFLYTSFAEEFLKLQQQRLKKLISLPKSDMCMAESIVTTIHVWMQSDPMLNPTHEAIADNEYFRDILATGWSETNHKIPAPVISVGIQCDRKSSFPEGTFMVQPAICVNGKWRPLGKISEKTDKRIHMEVNKLWKIRQEMIHRDTNIAGLFPDYDKMTGKDERRFSTLSKYLGDVEEVGEVYDPILHDTAQLLSQPTTGNAADIDTEADE